MWCVCLFYDQIEELTEKLALKDHLYEMVCWTEYARILVVVYFFAFIYYSLI